MSTIVTYIEQAPWLVIILLCLTLGLAPFMPEPHIVEKLRMLKQGSLTKPIDIFDMLLHAAPFFLLVAKLGLLLLKRGS